MKTQILSLAVMALVSANAVAAAEKWQGSGAAYSVDGQLLENYSVETTVTSLAPGISQSETTVTFADGSSKVISQKLTMNGTSWSNESNLGSGGGACYGGDVCENYIKDENGSAYSTTIVSDGPDARRDITVVLLNGKAVKVLRDKMVRLP